MYVELGKIVGVWGVKGWVKLHSYTRPRIDIAKYIKWSLRVNGKTDVQQSDSDLEIEVLNCREQGPGIVAQLAGIDDRDQAANLIGRQILVRQSDLPVLLDGQYYWQQLIGLNVSNLENIELGQISSILETGANDVLVIKGNRSDGADILIPNTEQVVKEVDIDQGTMKVDWDPDYLLD